MSQINIVDAISYLENFCFELMHSEERTTTAGTQTFKNDELNDNIQIVAMAMKFVLDKEVKRQLNEVKEWFKGEVKE